MIKNHGDNEVACKRNDMSEFHTGRKSSPFHELYAFDLVVWQFLLELPELFLVLWALQWQLPPWMQRLSQFPVLSDFWSKIKI